MSTGCAGFFPSTMYLIQHVTWPTKTSRHKGSTVVPTVQSQRFFCRQVETMMTTSEESPLMKAQLFRDHLPSQTNMSGWKIIPLNRRYTPPKLPWNLKITCLKRKMILQTSIFRVQYVRFFEGDTPSIHGCNFPACRSFVFRGWKNLGPTLRVGNFCPNWCGAKQIQLGEKNWTICL